LSRDFRGGGRVGVWRVGCDLEHNLQFLE
jgi:hypothetical protein